MELSKKKSNQSFCIGTLSLFQCRILTECDGSVCLVFTCFHVYFADFCFWDNFYLLFDNSSSSCHRLAFDRLYLHRSFVARNATGCLLLSSVRTQHPNWFSCQWRNVKKRKTVKWSFRWRLMTDSIEREKRVTNFRFISKIQQQKLCTSVDGFDEVGVGQNQCLSTFGNRLRSSN